MEIRYFSAKLTWSCCMLNGKKKNLHRPVKNISLFQSYLQEFLQVRHTWDIPIKVKIPLNQALPLLAPQNYSPCPWWDLRRIPKCIFQDVLHSGTFSSLWPQGPAVIPVQDNFSQFEGSEHFFPRKLGQIWGHPKPYSMGEWKKGRKWYNDRKIWKKTRPEVLGFFDSIYWQIQSAGQIRSEICAWR